MIWLSVWIDFDVFVRRENDIDYILAKYSYSIVAYRDLPVIVG